MMGQLPVTASTQRGKSLGGPFLITFCQKRNIRPANSRPKKMNRYTETLEMAIGISYHAPRR